MPDMKSIIKILKFENPFKPGTKFHAGGDVLMKLDGKTYGEFRRERALKRALTGTDPFSPSTTIKRAQEIGFVKLVPVGDRQHQNNKSQEFGLREDENTQDNITPEPEIVDITRLDEPLQDVVVFVAKSIDPQKPGIYVFVIEDVGIYVGKYTRPSRYKREYSNNVEKLRTGQPYRDDNPNGFRRIHRALARAVETDGQNISLLLIENWDDEGSGQRRERELINAIGTLND